MTDKPSKKKTKKENSNEVSEATFNSEENLQVSSSEETVKEETTAEQIVEISKPSTEISAKEVDKDAEFRERQRRHHLGFI